MLIGVEETADMITKMPKLTTWTARLFIVLYDRRGRVVTFETIEDHVPLDHADYDMTRGAVTSLVKRLRKQLAEMGCPVHIQTIYGLGYRMIIDDKEWKPG